LSPNGTKVLTLLALNQPDEAERFAKTAMAQAQAGDRRIREVELSMMLAQIAEKRGRPEQAMAHLEPATATARAGQVQRLLARRRPTLRTRTWLVAIGARRSGAPLRQSPTRQPPAVASRCRGA
jgi:hypothetical protein